MPGDKEVLDAIASLTRAHTNIPLTVFQKIEAYEVSTDPRARIELLRDAELMRYSAAIVDLVEKTPELDALKPLAHLLASAHALKGDHVKELLLLRQSSSGIIHPEDTPLMATAKVLSRAYYLHWDKDDAAKRDEYGTELRNMLSAGRLTPKMISRLYDESDDIPGPLGAYVRAYELVSTPNASKATFDRLEAGMRAFDTYTQKTSGILPEESGFWESFSSTFNRYTGKSTLKVPLTDIRKEVGRIGATRQTQKKRGRAGRVPLDNTRNVKAIMADIYNYAERSGVEHIPVPNHYGSGGDDLHDYVEAVRAAAKATYDAGKVPGLKEMKAAEAGNHYGADHWVLDSRRAPDNTVPMWPLPANPMGVPPGGTPGSAPQGIGGAMQGLQKQFGIPPTKKPAAGARKP